MQQNLKNPFLTKKDGRKKLGKQHVVAIVGYELNPNAAGGGYYIIKNSYGRPKNNSFTSEKRITRDNRNDYGYQYLEFAYCNNGKAECWTYDIGDVIIDSDINLDELSGS